MTKVKLTSITCDLNLLWQIQQATKQSTEDICAYFFTLVNSIIEETMKVSKAKQLNRKLEYFYPNTEIPLRIKVDSAPFDMENFFSHKDTDGAVPCFAEVGYCNNYQKFEQSEIKKVLDSSVEKGLGLTEGLMLPPLERPKVSIPLSARNLIKK